jgi:PAS domain S-box-containing protein
MVDTKDQKIDDAELRRRAEERLGEKGGIARPSASVEDPLRLLHELQVHQIELEMQNAELRQARGELESALERYTDLYDFAPVGYATLDRNGTIRAANLTGSGFVGVERARLIGQRLGQFIADTARSSFADFLEKVFTSRTRETCELAFLNQGDSERFVQIEGAVVASGEECRIALIDISERKRAADALRLAKKTAEVLRLANEAAEVLGLANATAETLRLTNEATDAFHLANEATEALRLANEATETLRLAKEAAETLRRAGDANEALCLANDTAEVLRLANEAAEALRLAKEAAMLLRLAKDAARELRQSKEACDATARTKSLFFANMSHELRTPMAALMGMLQVALREELAPAPREYVETALSQARSLLNILNDILDMSKIEAGKLAIEENPFSLHECLGEAVDLISPEVRRKGLDFTVSVAEAIPETVVGDHARLRQILLNLIGNAVKFTAAGQVAVRVTAAPTTSAGKLPVTFSVADSGIGIPADKQDLLFQTFSQVDASHTRLYGGAGLGLAICREIVELMGGTISFESQEGLGSTFSFTVPLGEAKLESIAQATPEALAHETIAVPEGERIPHLLLVEDEPHNRKALGLLLQWANFSLDFAEDGMKAIEMWEQGDYDLVLMDIQMPRLNGFEATRAIREKERERGGRTPIVAMTAHAFKDDEERCLAGGMDYYISKPIDINKCILLLRQIIGQNPRPITKGTTGQD